MPRIARIVAPGFPHHITQRGNRNQQVFFSDSDYLEYLRLLSFYSKEFNVKILSYCLMPNHVHLIAEPKDKDGLARAISQTHLKYTRMINFREDWRGYLWQGRFCSFVMDERHLLNATRYILLNPVRAGIVAKADDYKWSSVQHHMGSKKEELVKDELLQSLIKDWNALLETDISEQCMALIDLHGRTGRPLGGPDLVRQLEALLGRKIAKGKPGRKRLEDKKSELSIVSPEYPPEYPGIPN